MKRTLISTPQRRRKDRELAPHIVATPLSASIVMTDGLDGQAIEDAIRFRAYQLFEERGAEHGYASEDWFQAEREVRQRGVLDTSSDAILAAGARFVAA